AHFTVNGKKVNIPSYRVKVGDVIALREKSRGYEKFKDMVEVVTGATYPKWLEKDVANFSAKVIAMPDRADIDLPVEEHLIVELYSK
ncbi:MAG: 30S ribosomal protein S4, partial [Kiritimatiellae bacterium]|nr:30S ribosomal protein S4 [Kiritimatiellia bacterium]